ncbi:MAG TPA: transposase [Terriglobia bacterium]|nr:transposase [Terriglobia bacterium]
MGKLTHRTGPACTYFVTTKTWQNRALFKVPRVAEVVTNRLFDYRDRGTYLLHEFVVMPDHLHLLLTPGNTSSLEKAVMLVKGGSSHEIHRVRGHKMEIWQAGFHDWTVRDEADYYAKREYIWMNPVKAGLVERPEDWPFASAGGKFQLDPMPLRLRMASGAEAPGAPSR